jgi:hypothetical protein
MACWKLEFGEKCLVCGDDVLDMLGVCANCVELKRQAEAEPCKHCGGPLTFVVHKFSGRIRIRKGGRVHKECLNDFVAASRLKTNNAASVKELDRTNK